MKSELIMNIRPASMAGEQLHMVNERLPIIDHSILPKNDTCVNKILNSTSQDTGIPSIVIIDDNGITKVDELSLDSISSKNTPDINLVDLQSNKEQGAVEYSATTAADLDYMIKSDECLNLISGLNEGAQKKGSIVSSRSNHQHHVTFSLNHEEEGGQSESEVNNNSVLSDKSDTCGIDITCDTRAGQRKVLKTIELLGIRTAPPDSNEKHSKQKNLKASTSRRQQTRYKRLRQIMKMEENNRSNSNPDQLHFTLDETADDGGLRRTTSLKQNGRLRKVSVGQTPQSLPQSLEDISTQHLIQAHSTDNSDDERCSSRKHSSNQTSEGATIWGHRPSEFRIRDQLFSFFQASDNKLAMKLFGSRNALLKEKQRQMAAKSWIIHPCSNFRLYWDLLMLIFLVTNLVVLPVSIAFFYDDVGAHWIVFNITCDTMFILDILINFRTGLIDNESRGGVILESKVIALRYVKTWFFVDFISSLPLDYVFLGIEGQSYTAGRALRILRLAKLLQLLRLLRISRLVRYVRLWQEFFSLASIVVKLFNLICIMVLMGHWSGCIQFFVPVIQGLPEDSWIIIDQIQNAHWWEQYTRSLFKALSHMLCIGYGQYPPKNMTDTWLTIGSMLAGATCYALFIGHATTLIQSFDTSSRQFQDHLQQVNEYMIYRKLPTDLRRRITDYYEHRFGGKMFDEAAILSEVSGSLRKDVIYHNCRELIRNVPFFVNADNSFVMDVITKLEFEMFQPGDIIIKSATKGDRMFFIQEGLVEILSSEGKVVTRLGDGSYFGEISLLTQQDRVATVRAAAYCNVFSLSKEHFDRILENYPLMRRTMETVAAKRLHTLGIDPSLVTSRESLLDDVKGIQKVFQTNGAIEESSDDEYDHCISPTSSKESNSQFLTVVKSFFTKDSEDFSPTSRNSSHRTIFSSPGDSSSIQRCKSTLNHLILVPQVKNNFTRRVKSTADVQNFATAQEFKLGRIYGSQKSNDNIPSSPSSHSNLFSRNTDNHERCPLTPNIESPVDDTRPKFRFNSQPSSPQLSPTKPHHIVPNVKQKQPRKDSSPNTPPARRASIPQDTAAASNTEEAYNLTTMTLPEVRIIPESDSSLNNISDDEAVKFCLSDSPL